jgi:hypothetical protein
MEITTGIIDYKGNPLVGLRVQESVDDNDPITYILGPELARKVAFSLMEEADKLDPPAWREEQ